MSGRCLSGLVFSSAWALAGCPGPRSECTDCFDHDGYQIEFSSVPDETEPPPAVLFSGWRNGHCRHDQICGGTPEVFLGDVRWGTVDWSRDCDPEDQEVIAFAGGYQPYVATPAVPAGTGVSLEGTVDAVRFQPAFRIDVKLWVVPRPVTTGAAAQAEALAQAQAQASALIAPDGQTVTARRIYADLGTGIDLHFTSAAFPIEGIAEGDLRLLYESASCDLVATITGRGAVGYDAAQLNVYYVDWVQGNRAGVNCFARGYPNIMFVLATASYSALQLAHELGHAMGLQRSTTVPQSGDVAGSGDLLDEMFLDEYLHEDNLMRSGGHEVKQVTLGQIYRMHYDKLSWKWKQPTPPAAITGYPRECQNSPVAGGGCPPLTLHPARGWP